MGPRMREDKGGVFTPILTFPPQGGRDGREGGREGRPCGGNRDGAFLRMSSSEGLAEGGEAFGHCDFD